MTDDLTLDKEDRVLTEKEFDTQKNNYKFKDKIFCHCVYEFNDKLKKIGFKWDASFKLWHINYDRLTYDSYIKTRVIRFTNYTTIGILNYFYVYYKSKDVMNNLIEEMKINKLREDEEEPKKDKKKTVKTQGLNMITKRLIPKGKK